MEFNQMLGRKYELEFHYGHVSQKHVLSFISRLAWKLC